MTSAGLELSPGKPSQKAWSSLLGSFSFTLLPPLSPLSSPALTRVEEWSGWCTSPTRCSSQTRSYDLRLSVFDDFVSARVLRNLAISVPAFGSGIGGKEDPSWVRGVSTKCQYL